MNPQRFSIEHEGKTITFETGQLAPQANSAVLVKIGETIVMATATMSKEAREKVDFFPLMVDYEERYYAAGRILGPRYAKREGKPADESILIGRMIDRGLRPRFPQDLRNEVQVICYPLSFDGVNKPDIAAMLAAAAAVHISDIPFNGPTGAVRIGRINGEFIVNPTIDEIIQSDLQLVVQGDGIGISMVDCDANEIEDEVLLSAFELAIRVMGSLTEFIDSIRTQIGKEKAKTEELTWSTSKNEEEMKVIDELKGFILQNIENYLFNGPKVTKYDRMKALDDLKTTTINEFKNKLISDNKFSTAEDAELYLKGIFNQFYYDFIKEQVSKAILSRGLRVDGRSLTDIRPLNVDVGLLPRTHGSGLFNRGETQVLSIVTLGAPSDELSMENIEEEGTKKFFHHYNFPPYCVGEVRPLRGTGRREIGHGALAEKALRPVIPDNFEFPYTIRVVSEVMSSNGSSSMASTCSTTLALMDAGVKIKRPIAGIAMGLAMENGTWKVITDLQDLEDGPGGMDFKVTSSRVGITAIQMDCKSSGLNMDIINTTLSQARPALIQITDIIEAAIPEPRAELSNYAPRIISFMISPEKIGDVIGPGGKVVRELQERFEVQIDIIEGGKVFITAYNKENAELAEREILEIVRVVEIGDIFEEAEVVKIINAGAFLRLTRGTDGFLRTSEIDHQYVDKVTDRLKLGDKVRVKVINIENGKVEVSMKALLPPPPGGSGYRDRSYDRRSGGGRSSYHGRRDSRSQRGRSGGMGGGGRERRY